MMIFQLILKQPTKHLNSMTNLANYHGHCRGVILCIIFSWTLILAVFTYIFYCSLILSHIKAKPVMIVESIKDVLDNSQINVAGQFSIQKMGNIFYQGKPYNLIQRAQKYEKKMNLGGISSNPNTNFINLNILKDMINGRTVVLVNSFLRLIMQDAYHEFNLVSAMGKYSQCYVVYSVFKNHEYSTQIANA